MSNQHDPENAATLFWRLVEAVQNEHGLDDDEALIFIKESCSAGGMPTDEADPELVEQLREAALFWSADKRRRPHHPDHPF